MKSTTKQHFAQIPEANIQRSKFDRGHGAKTTFNAGDLIPIFVDEALPGDTLSLNLSSFARLATPLKPVMDNMMMETFFFAVPNRLLWQNWERFNGAQDNPGDSTSFLVPQLEPAIFASQSISDYFSIPTLTPAAISVNAWWHRAYNLIWNEFFRDENLQDQVPKNIGDGPDLVADYTILKRGKRADYFTKALPFPQKGPAVSIPLGGTAPITGIGSVSQIFNSPNLGVTETGGASVTYPDAITFSGADVAMRGTAATSGDPEVYADLTAATAATIASLREAFQVQKMYERDARGGTRYTELLRSHFNVTNPDFRLQRPEYLGGSSTAINLTVVPQTTPDATATPQGNLAAFGTAATQDHVFTKSFTEHMTIIGLVCVRADLTYQQGLNRMFSRQTRFDYYWPTLAHLSEQEVLNKEIFADGSANDDLVFGYQERYAEYRYKPSQVTGQFRSNFPQSLDVWHLAQDFANLPVLGPTFIEENPPIDRTIAVPSEIQFIFDSYFSYICARPMPTYSVPGLMDHF